jgi:hypothetical protein
LLYFYCGTAVRILRRDILVGGLYIKFQWTAQKSFQGEAPDRMDIQLEFGCCTTI